MADRRYIDVDTTDAFLDKPRIRYTDGKRPATGKQLDRLLDPEYRREHGLPPLRPLPPPVEH